jgi:hypothetical protein
MNKKIRELAEQAGAKDDGDYWGDEYFTLKGEEDIEKFAQLIILECVNACLKATNEDSPVHLVSIAYADNVKKHFGIE